MIEELINAIFEAFVTLVVGAMMMLIIVAIIGGIFND